MDGIGQTISLFREPSQLVKVDSDPSTLFKMTVSHLRSSDFLPLVGSHCLPNGQVHERMGEDD